MKRIKFVGLDVHAETITVAVAEQEGEVRPLGVEPNRVESIRKLVKKLGPVGQLRHGRRRPTGVRPWTLNYRSWVKHEVHFEPMAQEATLLDYVHEVDHAELRIARLNLAIDEAVKSTPPKMRAVIEALQALRGVAQVTAVTIVAERGEVSRFTKARQLMGYGGIVASEHPSGESTWRGGITKTGNAHLRRVVVEAAWAYRHRPSVGETLRKRQAVISEEIREIAWKAQHRLHTYRKLMARGKEKEKVVTAIGRELLGFIWAIGVKAEAAQEKTERRAA
jgi:transposase